MKTRRCGTSGLQLPILGVGCWSFGGGEYWGDQEQHDVDSIVAAAIDLGCNYFDTAEVYNDGRSEAALGTALKGKRSKAIIGSKISPDHTDPSTLRIHCEASLRRLGTDYIDVYMVHWPINPVSIQHYTGSETATVSLPETHSAFATLKDLQTEGKIRYIGVSNFGPRQLMEVRDFGVVVNELCYNILSRAIEIEIAPLCGELGIGIIGYMPLMQGLLTGKYGSLEKIPWQRTRSRHFSGARQGSRHGEPGFEDVLIETIDEITDIANTATMKIADLALAWSMSNPSICCTISGIRNARQLESNAKAADKMLDFRLRTALDAASLKLKEVMGPYADLYEAAENTRIY